jgi:hypothetical protein
MPWPSRPRSVRAAALPGRRRPSRQPRGLGPSAISIRRSRACGPVLGPAYGAEEGWWRRRRAGWPPGSRCPGRTRRAGCGSATGMPTRCARRRGRCPRPSSPPPEPRRASPVLPRATAPGSGGRPGGPPAAPCAAGSPAPPTVWRRRPGSADGRPERCAIVSTTQRHRRRVGTPPADDVLHSRRHRVTRAPAGEKGALRTRVNARNTRVRSEILPGNSGATAPRSGTGHTVGAPCSRTTFHPFGLGWPGKQLGGIPPVCIVTGPQRLRHEFRRCGSRRQPVWVAPEGHGRAHSPTAPVRGGGEALTCRQRAGGSGCFAQCVGDRLVDGEPRALVEQPAERLVSQCRAGALFAARVFGGEVPP